MNVSISLINIYLRFGVVCAGAVYVGHFFDNMFHGFGRILYPNKTIVEGIWYQGELTNPAVIFSDGLEFDAINWDYLEDDDRRCYDDFYFIFFIYSFNKDKVQFFALFFVYFCQAFDLTLDHNQGL